MWIKSLLGLRLDLRILFVCALLRFVATAQDIQISLPLSPLSPKQMQECDQLQSQWDSLHKQVATAHQKCLDAHSTGPVTPNSGGSGPGSICSRSECQSLHSTIFSDIEPQSQARVQQCRDDVNEYEQQQAATQKAVQLAQQQLQQQVNYFRNRGQQLADQARAGQQAATQQVRDMQANQQSAHQQMEAQLKTAAQDSVDQLEAQKTSSTVGLATDSAVPTADSSSAATVPSDAVAQQTNDGSAQAREPNPQPNVVSDPAPATHNSSDMTVEQYQANGLSLEDAQKAVEYNSASGTASRATDNLTSQLTQPAPSDSSQPDLVGAASSSDPPATGHDATPDDLRFAADMKAAPLLVKPVLDSWKTIPTLITYMEGGAPAVIWDTMQGAAKDKVKEILFGAISQELCSHPTNQATCAKSTPTSQPGPVPSKSNQ